MSMNINVTVPADLRAAIKQYMAEHPEFNLSGFIQKQLRELLLRESPALLGLSAPLEVARHGSVQGQ